MTLGPSECPEFFLALLRKSGVRRTVRTRRGRTLFAGHAKSLSGHGSMSPFRPFGTPRLCVTLLAGAALIGPGTAMYPVPETGLAPPDDEHSTS